MTTLTPKLTIYQCKLLARRCLGRGLFSAEELHALQSLGDRFLGMVEIHEQKEGATR